LRGSSSATAKRDLKSSPAWRIPVVIAPASLHLGEDINRPVRAADPSLAIGDRASRRVRPGRGAGARASTDPHADI
jgi:hypothetical protein